QIHNLFIVLETDQGMLMIDQHAAHERILYEQYQLQFETQKRLSTKYQLLTSEFIELDLADFQLLSDNLDHFTQLGFELEPFSDKTFKLMAAPEIFKDHQLVNLINELLNDLKLD